MWRSVHVTKLMMAGNFSGHQHPMTSCESSGVVACQFSVLVQELRGRFAKKGTNFCVCRFFVSQTVFLCHAMYISLGRQKLGNHEMEKEEIQMKRQKLGNH